ncbi:MAG: DEAD/DEAH box helicase [Bacteroidota bacterium]
MSFQTFKLNKQLHQALGEAGYTVPTPIQQKAILPGLAGRDVLGIAPTGTGKTVAYLVPLLMQLKYAVGMQPRGLILAPSKELVMQIADHLAVLAKYTDLRSACLYGGTGLIQQCQAVSQGVDLLVATPGRLLDLYHRGAFQLRTVRYVVLDEADKLLALGFLPQLRAILDLLPPKRQHFLFSATMPALAMQQAEEFVGWPVKVMVAPQATPAATVRQQCYHVPNIATKARLLALLLTDAAAFHKVLVFTRTRQAATQVAHFLQRKATGEVRVIHANKGQNTRIHALAAFRAGTVRILVATEVAARGIDVSQVSHVINFEVPTWPAEYVHRIGRTGRAAHPGQALTFVNPAEVYYLQQIEKLIHQKIPVLPLPPALVVTPTPFEERQAMARVLDRQRQKEDPHYQGAFHAKKKQRPKRAKR